jgi:hypothetical protein
VTFHARRARRDSTIISIVASDSGLVPGMRRLRTWLLVGSLLVSACGEPDAYDVAEARQPIRAVLRVHWARRDITTRWHRVLGVKVDGGWVPVACQSPVSRGIPESRAEGLLAVDAAGQRVAARCDARDAWNVYVVAGEHSFALCPDASLTGAHLPWARVPDIETAAMQAVACGSAPFATAARALERRLGRRGLGRFVRAMATQSLGRPGVGETAESIEADFAAAVTRVSAEDRAAVERTLLDVLLTPREQAYTRRALRVVRLSRPELTKDVLGELLARCGAATRDVGCDALLRRFATVAPHEASASVCALTGRVSDFDLGSLRLAVLAQAGERCAPWAERHEREACTRLQGGRTCPSGGPRPCTAEDYRAEIAAELALPPGVGFPDASFTHQARMATAAGRAMGIGCAGPPLGAIGPNLRGADER